MRRTLRTAGLLLALALTAAPAAAQEGGSAACTVPFQVSKPQPLGGTMLEPGPFKLTVLDTSALSCDEARDELREVLRAPGGDLPEGWKFDDATRTVSRANGDEAFRVEPDASATVAAD